MNEKKLQVLFIASWYPNKIRPLLGIFVKRYAAALTQSCSISVIYICANNEHSIEESTEDNIYTIKVYYKKVMNSIPLYSHSLKLLRYLLAWKKALHIYSQKKGRPDIIHSAIVWPASIIARYLKYSWKTPYIISEHWTGYLPEDGRYKGFLMRLLSRITIKNASSVVTDSNRLKDRMQELGLTNTYYSIPNVVDVMQFNIPQTIQENKSINFIHISSFDEEQKNVSGIIRTFAKVHADYPNVTLTLIGDGEKKIFLQELSESLKLKDFVKFTGLKIGNELVELIQSSSAFILFSNYENMISVMLEAMACGIPVIGTRTGDVPDVINSKNGVLVDARNEDQLKDAMVSIIKNKGQFNSQEIRNSVINKVSPDEIAKQYLAVYNSVLNQGK